jgi:hypothetical protein
MAIQYSSKIHRLLQKVPKFALAYIRRKIARQAKRIIPIDDWNIHWLGEEMRPFNSLRS